QERQVARRASNGELPFGGEEIRQPCHDGVVAALCARAQQRRQQRGLEKCRRKDLPPCRSRARAPRSPTPVPVRSAGSKGSAARGRSQPRTWLATLVPAPAR